MTSALTVMKREGAPRDPRGVRPASCHHHRSFAVPELAMSAMMTKITAKS